MDSIFEFISKCFIVCLFVLLLFCMGVGENNNKQQTPRQIEIQVRYEYYFHLTDSKEAAATLVLAETQQDDNWRPD